MSRVIKFRAFDTQRNVMYSAAELGRDEMQLHPDGRGFFNASSVSQRLSQYYSHLLPMQFTGLHDKNGKEIYEGDIISLIDDVGDEILVICEFGTIQREIYGQTLNLCDITGFYFRKDNRATFPIVNNYAGKHDLELFEVIGNIHQNPELLQ